MYVLVIVLQLAAAHAAIASPSHGGARSPAWVVDSLYFAHRPDAALALAESALRVADRPELRWRAARALIAIGVNTPDPDARVAAYSGALVHAHGALALAPDDVAVRYWAAAAAGRRAQRRELAYSVQLARQVFEHASFVLATDSNHAGAHHALGQLHAEVSRLPRILRLVVARVLGGDARLLTRARPSLAEGHLRRAVELEPSTATFAADLAALLCRTGRHDEAVAIAIRSLSRPMKDPADRPARAQLRSLLCAPVTGKHESLGSAIDFPRRVRPVERWHHAAGVTTE